MKTTYNCAINKLQASRRNTWPRGEYWLFAIAINMILNLSLSQPIGVREKKRQQVQQTFTGLEYAY